MIRVLSLSNVSGGYGDKKIIKNMTFKLNNGEILGLLGPNGSGKTTLFKFVSGELKPTEGSIILDDKSLFQYKPKDLAKYIGVLPQSIESSFSYSVQETVRLGRYAHQKGLFSKWSHDDEVAVNRALEVVNMTTMKDMSIDHLSGGERQRVYLARALAQDPKILLLDEPTNHLDISHQMMLFDSLSDWVQKNNASVFAIFHDLNLASLYCDRIMVIENGRMVTLQNPENALKEQTLRQVYKTKVVRKSHPEVPTPLITFLPKKKQASMSNILSNLAVTHGKDQIKIESSVLFKTLSSSVVGSGFGWNRFFVNRHVDHDYNHEDPAQDLKDYLVNQQIDPEHSVGMMTAAMLEDAAIEYEQYEDVQLCVVVTAGTSNAVDISKAYKHSLMAKKVNTINIWVFIEGYLPEAAFLQALMSATEAKVKALQTENIIDAVTHTTATGTSTDSIMIGATQTGKTYEYAGSITPVGKAIGKTVHTACVKAVKSYKNRIE